MEQIEFDLKSVNIKITTFGVNSSEIEGLDTFEEELQSQYTTERKDEECVACGGSSDLELLVNICDYFSNIVVSGLIWDLSKGILSHLWQSIKKLGDNNQHLALYVTIQLEDFELRISEAMYESYNTLETLFRIIYEEIQYLNSKGFDEITRISMPYIETEDKETRFVAKGPYEDFTDYWWEVTYRKGCRVLYFNHKTHEIFIHN